MQGNRREKSQRPGRKTMRAVFAPWIAGLVLALCLAGGAWAEELTGRVVGVTDGDTVRLLVERQEIRIRLDQIDAPEKRQPFGSRSKESLSELVFGKTVRAVTSGKDRYGRSLATLYAGNLNANAEQVRRGMAWVYRQYPVEEEARRAKRGLWSDPQPSLALGVAQDAARQETLDPGIAV
jgi:endonuclease YncB( thermonuclease family)